MRYTKLLFNMQLEYTHKLIMVICKVFGRQASYVVTVAHVFIMITHKTNDYDCRRHCLFVLLVRIKYRAVLDSRAVSA